MKGRSIISVLILAIICAVAVQGEPFSQTEFAKELLQEQNKLRVLHHAPPMKLSDKLMKDALEWATHLAEINQMQFGGQRKGEGENLAAGSKQLSALACANMWYKKIKNYDFSHPGFNPNAGAFTQLVWKGTTEFGAAKVVSKEGKAFVVARYYKPGNINSAKAFAGNVLPIHPIKGMNPITSAPTKPIDQNMFAKELLDAQNKYRILHHAPPLKLSAELMKDAEEWATHLAEINKMQHARGKQRQEQGENLAAGPKQLSAQMCANLWYKEIKNYDFNHPGFEWNSGHFTQLVWKGSTEFGAAKVVSKEGKAFVVARYYKPGNYNSAKAFAKNVLPIKQ